MEKQRLFSGIQPTGNLTLGNYIGALSGFESFQDRFECIYSIVDLHSITVSQDPSKLRANSASLLALYLASGLDPEKTTIFVQSHVSQHAELAWILNTISYLGELSRMTQFKDKSQKHKNDNINLGLMAYPTLMAADILLYRSALVPVGQDQKQHLELARTLATRFNNRFAGTFVVPEGHTPKTFGKVMSLSDPTKKMSKSDENVNGFVAILDDPDTIMRKFKKAVTDSGDEVFFSSDKPGVSNLLTIYAFCKGISLENAEKEMRMESYKTLKEAVGESVCSVLQPLQEKYYEILKNKNYLEKVMKDGGEKASYMASKTLAKVYKKVGFLPKVR